MRLPGTVGQINQGEIFYDASGTITTGNTPQLLLPKARSRSSLLIQNISTSATMYIELGNAKAVATVTNGAVTAVTVTNPGMFYTLPPTISFLGGAFDNKNQITPTFSYAGLPEFPAPTAPNGRHAKAHCVMTGSAGALSISSIVIDDPGKGYLYAPYVSIRNAENDTFGVANPYYNSTNSGIQLLPGGSYTPNGTICTTDAISINCATTGAAFTCKYTI